jgi:replication factor A1
LEEPTPVKKGGALKAVDLQIKDLTAETKLVNLKATVIEKSIIRMVFSRFGDALLVSTATISDDTGSTKLTLWNNQIDTISVGDAIQIENGQVKTFRGELHVSLGRRGKLHVIENKSTRKLRT